MPVTLTFSNGDKIENVSSDFYNSCTFITNFIDTMGLDAEDEEVEVPMLKDFTAKMVQEYIDFFEKLYSLKVTSDSGEEMIFIDYIDTEHEEYVKNYTNASKKPPHCETMVQMYNDVGDDKIQTFMRMDAACLDNSRMMRGIAQCITAFTTIGSDEDVEPIMSQIARIQEEIYEFEGKEEEKRTAKRAAVAKEMAEMEKEMESTLASAKEERMKKREEAAAAAPAPAAADDDLDLARESARIQKALLEQFTNKF